MRIEVCAAWRGYNAGMTINVPAEHLKNAITALGEGSIIKAVFALTRPGGAGIVEAKTWVEGLCDSADPLEAALGAAYLEAKAVRDAAPVEELTAAEDQREAARETVGLPSLTVAKYGVTGQYDPAADEELLARGLAYAFPGDSLDLGLALLFYPSGVPLLSLARAAHLCRLSNSFCAAWRGGEVDEAGARAIVRGGSPGYSEASYDRAWDNARQVNGG